MKYTTSMNAGRARTMDKISETLLELLSEKPFSQITITELSSRSNIVRKTFYRNFGTKEAVAEWRLEKMFYELNAKRLIAELGTRSVFLHCYEYFLTNRNMARLLMDRDLYPLVLRKVKECVEGAYGEVLNSAVSFAPPLFDFYIAFISDGIIALFRTWLEDNCHQPPDAMATLTEHLLSGVIA